MRRRSPRRIRRRPAFTGPNTFLRLDYHVNGNNQISFRWTREAIITESDSIEDDKAIPDAARHENDAGDYVFSASWTSVLNNRATNELNFGHVRESLLQGPSVLFDDSWNFIGFHGIDPFDVGSQNTHPDYLAGPRNTYAQDLIRDFNVDDSFTLIKSGWKGEHTFKLGAGYSRNGALPQGTARTSTGSSPSRRRTVQRGRSDNLPLSLRHQHGPVRFHRDRSPRERLHLGQMADQSKLTLNLGVRYDWQDATPNTKDAFGPRVGVAYDLLGDGKTLVRGGFGKVYSTSSSPCSRLCCNAR